MKPSWLFITGGKEISSHERTTHEDSITTKIYALGLMPLLTAIIDNNTWILISVAFADDLTGEGKVHELIEWWKNVLYFVP